MARAALIRRDVLAGASRLGLACAAARTLGAGEGFAATAGPDEARLKIAVVRQTVSAGRTLACYMAVPNKARGRHAAVLVAHGDHGLDEPSRALARHVALLGYVACAPDFLSRAGETAAQGNVARAVRELDLTQAIADALGTILWLGRNPPGERVLSGRVAALGRGWGGALVERLAPVAGGALAGGIVLSAMADAEPDPASAVPLLHVLGDGAAPDDPAWGEVGRFLKERLT